MPGPGGPADLLLRRGDLLGVRAGLGGPGALRQAHPQGLPQHQQVGLNLGVPGVQGVPEQVLSTWKHLKYVEMCT